MSTSVVVYSTVHDDGSAKFTVDTKQEKHRFSAVPRGNSAGLVYEETLSWRGQIRVSEPDEEIWKALIQSDEMTEYLDAQHLNGVAR